MHLIGVGRQAPAATKAIAVAEYSVINCRCYRKRRDQVLVVGPGRKAAKRLHLLLLRMLAQEVAGRGRRD